MSNTIYYVYAYLRSKDSETALAGTPYYIGYGKGQRAFNKHRIPVPKDKSKIVFLHENLSEDQAKDLEIQEIARYGRKDLGTGILTNLTNGGKTHSEETKKKMSIAKKGKPAPGNHRGKKHSEEAKQKLSEAVNRRSEEQKRSFAECRIGEKHSIETKKKMSAAQSGVNNHCYGKKWFYNPISMHQIMTLPHNVPENYVPGRIPKITK
jgi:hypothetical protein